MEAGKPFFTIIVACCDVEPYVADAVTSVKEQSFQDFECILVVEKSKDGTLEACQCCSNGDDRFYIVQQGRSGSPSAPRNTGLRLAKGQYALFLDGDDYLVKDCLEKLSKAIQEKNFPDVIQMASEEWEDIQDKEPVFVARYFNYRKEDHGSVMTGVEAELLRSSLTMFPLPMASLSVCRVDFIRENDLYFCYGLRHEDEEWTPRAMFFAKSLLILDTDLYIYRRRAGSITTSNKKPDVRSIVRGVVNLVSFYGTHQVPLGIERTWGKQLSSRLFFFLFYKFPSSRQNSSFLRLAVMRHYLKSPDIYRYFLCLFRGESIFKRIGMKIMFWCVRNKSFKSILPCDLYFRCIYYPLMKLRGGWKQG